MSLMRKYFPRKNKRKIIVVGRERINDAVAEHLKNGGTIKREALGAKKWETNE